ncbi:MAG: M48 family metalloprotease [Gammaproteobacteria bacterium]
MRILNVVALAGLALAFAARAEELSAVVRKDKSTVYAEPSLEAAKLPALSKNAAVKIVGQQGLWYQLRLPDGNSGYLRVNDVRVDYAGAEGGDANLRVLMTGKAGKGRVTETAGVRGIEESELQSAALDQGQLDAMLANLVDSETAAANAGDHGWQATTVAFKGEGKPGGKSSKSDIGAAGAMLGGFGQNVSSFFGAAEKVAPKSEEELLAEEQALGPEIVGRILGARPLWDDAEAQGRVNLVGRWLADQTVRPELPWAFGVIDTQEVNAFAAPGGYVMISRGLYEMLSSDAELAAVLGHEISHCVQRDHYDVVRKQEFATIGKDYAMAEVPVTDDPAIDWARQYAEQHGATIMLATLDRAAEYRADEAAEFYLARAGMNPMALYSVLQKMTALGSRSAALAALYKTHPPLDARMDRIDKRGYAGLEAYTSRE